MVIGMKKGGCWESNDFREVEATNPQPSPYVCVDHGEFTVSDVAVAMADGKLDEGRMERLREGFFALLQPY